MKQVIQDMRSGKTRILEVPVPSPTTGQILIRTQASLISPGTERMVVDFAAQSILGKARSRPDLVRQLVAKTRRDGLRSSVRAAAARLSEPMILGYSSAGTVVEVGKGVEGFQPGDRVACAGGGHAIHAEFNLVPTNLCVPLPESLLFEEGAFATVGAIALHAFRLSGSQVGDMVAVVGLGLLGQLIAQIARASGCRVFGVDLRPDRVELAKKLGASFASVRRQAEQQGLSFSSGRGFDAIIIAADTPGNDPVQLAPRLCRDRGRVVIVGAVGMEIPRTPYYQKEIDLVVSRSYGPGRYDPEYEERGLDYPYGYVRWTENRNMRAFLELVAERKVLLGPLVTHRFPVEQAPEAYELLRHRGEGTGGAIILSYPSNSAVVRSVEIPAGGAAARKGEKCLRLGVLGSGNFANLVALPILSRLEGVAKVAVVSQSGLSAERAARRFGFQRCGSREEDVIGSPDVDCVAVFTRHHLHARQTAQALAAGQHVFCEKPLALSLQELEQVETAVAAAAQGGKRLLLTVGFNRRFSPLAVRVRQEIVTASEPATMQMRVNAGYLPPDHWVQDPGQGGGRILGEVCHFIDLLLYLAGDLPQTLFACAVPDLGRYRGDNLAVTLRFGNGTVANLIYTAAGDSSFEKERLEAFAGGTAMVLDDFRQLTIIREGKRRTVRSPGGQDKGHTAIWKSFVQAILAGGPDPIPLQELFATTRAAFAIERSLRTGAVEELGLEKGSSSLQ
jgi:predicted dehydrogenase/threonine dehydrogenase-like Zn-dependent dehydrogenase